MMDKSTVRDTRAAGKCCLPFMLKRQSVTAGAGLPVGDSGPNHRSKVRGGLASGSTGFLPGVRLAVPEQHPERGRTGAVCVV